MLILASQHREQEIYYENIRRMKLITRTSLKSLAWILMPFSIFIMLYLSKDVNIVMQILVGIVALALVVMSVIKMDKYYYLVISTKDGYSRRIRVSEDNLKDARKFLQLVRKQLSKKKIVAIKKAPIL